MKFFRLLSVCILLTACKQKPTENETQNSGSSFSTRITLTEGQENSFLLNQQLPEKGAISSVLKLTGKVDVPPQNIVSVSIPLGGYLKSTHLLPGTPIRKGEVLATLEDVSYIRLQQEYLTTKARLSFAETELKRQQILGSTQSVSEKSVQQSQLEYSTQKVALKALSEQLKLINIDPGSLNESNISKTVRLLSPVNGFVSNVNVNIGKYVNPTDVLFELIDPSDIHLTLNVFEKDINDIQVGQKVYASTNKNPEQKIPATVLLMSKSLKADGTSEVHCHFDKYDPVLFPGMYMSAEIEVKNHLAYLIPESAIVFKDNKNYIFILRGNREFELHEIQTGARENGKIEIKNGERFKDIKIVTQGAYTLLMELNKE